MVDFFAPAGVVLTSVLALAGSVTAQNASAAGEGGLVAYANSGSYRGSNVTGGVRQWLGVRWGKPTNGTRRFKPPQRYPVLPQSQIVNATQYGDSCPQNRGSAYTGFQLFLQSNETDSEDCLNVNIWAPSVSRLNKTNNGAAVAVWIYGGAYTFGSASLPVYNGSVFVRDNDDLIIVGLNYRTNLFGFPQVGAPSLRQNELNLGLMDQRMAVEWVYDNIKAFGGDPNRISIFGESAGASSVGLWPYAYAANPIVKGLVMESGSEFLLSSIGGAGNATGFQYIANLVGCGVNSNFSTTATSPASTTSGSIPTAAPTGDVATRQIRCMQAVPFRTLQQAVSNYTEATNQFKPVIDNATVFSPQMYASMSARGEFARLPVLIGSNDNEGTILTALTPGVPAQTITDLGFTCPAANVATARYNYSVPSWQYRYLFTSNTTNAFPALGVFHSSEIPIVFGQYNDSSRPAASAALVQVSRAVQGGWAAFFKDPARGLADYGWPVYQPNGTSLIQIGANSSLPAITFNNSQAYNKPCGAPLATNRSANAAYARVQDIDNGVDYSYLGAYTSTTAAGRNAKRSFRGRFDSYMREKYVE